MVNGCTFSADHHQKLCWSSAPKYYVIRERLKHQYYQLNALQAGNLAIQVLFDINVLNPMTPLYFVLIAFFLDS